VAAGAAFSDFIVACVLRRRLFGLIASAMIVVIIATAAFGPNVRGNPLDPL
jgi:MFS transporter, putative metabolite:H+ symporter